MLKEIDYWCRMSNNQSASAKISSFIGSTHVGLRKMHTSGSGNGGLFDFKDCGSDPQDEQIQMSLNIHQNDLDYMKTFMVVCSKLSLLFNTFNMPNLVWKMVNYLSFILEKNTESAEKLIECLKQLNIIKLL